MLNKFFVLNNFFPLPKIVLFVLRYGRARQATDDRQYSTAHARCMANT